MQDCAKAMQPARSPDASDDGSPRRLGPDAPRYEALSHVDASYAYIKAERWPEAAEAAWSYALCMLVAAAVCALLGAVVERLLLRPGVGLEDLAPLLGLDPEIEKKGEQLPLFG